MGDAVETGVPEDLSTAMTALEKEAVDLFVQLARILGQPKSVGEIYGLLFMAEQPIPMDRIIARLAMSKGSASQGLRVLRSLGAVRMVYQPGDRRDHYVAEASLKVLASGFIQGEILPHLERGESRLEHMERLVKETEWPSDRPATRKFYTERVKRLANWHRRGRQILPVLMRIID